MDDNDKKPVGEGIGDNDDCEDPAASGNQASPSPSPVQDAPENEEFPSGMSAETSSRSAAENLNTNQLNDIFYSSRHLHINVSCSQLVDALLSPRQFAILLKDQSGSVTSSVPSSHGQTIDQLEEASSINAPVSNRQRQRVLSVLDTSAGTSSQTSVPTSQTTERSRSVLGESRASDCVSALPSTSARETTQIPQPARKARKSLSSKSSLSKAIHLSSSRQSFETGFESTSAKKAETERSQSDSSESEPRHESFRSKPSPSAAEGTFCNSPINAQARKIRIAAQQDETSEPLSGPRRNARKSLSSKSSLSKPIHFPSSRRSFETDFESTSAKKAETELSESDSGESGPRHESFRSKPSPSAAEGTLCYSRIRALAREIGTAAQQGDTSVPLTVPLSSREREGTSSGSSECEDSRKQRKTPSSDEHSNEESGSNSTSAAEESSPSGAEGTVSDSPINAQEREIRIAAQQDETSEPLSEPLTSRKRERTSGSSSENVDSKKQRKMLASGDELSNEESSPSTVGDPLYIQPGEATSEHRPTVSDSPARTLECSSEALKLLTKVFYEIVDSGDETSETARNLFHEIPNLRGAELSNALQKYYRERLRNWNQRKKSLHRVEYEVQETNEIFVRIVVQSFVSFGSLSNHDCYPVMLDYRNFSNFYAEFNSYWVGKNMDDIQDEEIRNRARGSIQRIETCIPDMREAFRNLLEVVQVLAEEETYMDILETYKKDLLEGDESFLPELTP